MWVFTTEGFVSVVQGSVSSQKLIVRARDRQSLESLAVQVNDEIKHTPDRDYPYRLVIAPTDFQQWLTGQAQALDYHNFKDAVHIERGHQYANALLRVWSAMHDVEDDAARVRY